MTTWNDIRFLHEAVDGVLAQTMADFEFIVVDNGSDHRDEVAALAGLDRRIRTLRLNRNLGPAEAGNRGIALALAPIVARMDNDDRAEPGWLEAVTAALDEDCELGLVGTWATLISEHGDPLGIDRTPESDFAIRFTLLSHNPFYHSSTAYRRELIDLVGGIEAGQDLTHDHRLWRALLPHCRARNLPRALCRYRYNPRGITGTSDPATKRSRSSDIRIGLWRELGLDYPLEDRSIGDAVDDFLRDRPCRNPELWAEVGMLIESALARTSAQAEDFLRPRDLPERNQFVAELRDRLARGPKAPPTNLERLLLALKTRGPRRVVAAVGRKLSDAIAGLGKS
jgi:glycosyltransferase involved in cell wall biosynthesis